MSIFGGIQNLLSGFMGPPQGPNLTGPAVGMGQMQGLSSFDPQMLPEMGYKPPLIDLTGPGARGMDAMQGQIDPSAIPSFSGSAALSAGLMPQTVELPADMLPFLGGYQEEQPRQAPGGGIHRGQMSPLQMMALAQMRRR